ncbi:hypothetical protein Hbl1158_11575 [Halobaculum sp. CBA1158]|uniref:DUF5789 family protein n=1 Tax=Halobaculum sp. CBA1158 TaxID=2904243 RepID=UPI001F409AA0|nr:hypothetical protein [Halobaculum sp. CBA1158]UIO99169.1 hypothetical protein Hbl1158_11575 [Halobaculum sp. CBA1158]
MRLSELRAEFSRQLSFPTDRETAVERVGDVTLEAPNGDDTTVAAVLARAETAEFDSAKELHDTLVGLVDDAFIGRKFYDDRGGQTGMENDQQSF